MNGIQLIVASFGINRCYSLVPVSYLVLEDIPAQRYSDPGTGTIDPVSTERKFLIELMDKDK